MRRIQKTPQPAVLSHGCVKGGLGSTMDPDGSATTTAYPQVPFPATPKLGSEMDPNG